MRAGKAFPCMQALSLGRHFANWVLSLLCWILCSLHLQLPVSPRLLASCRFRVSLLLILKVSLSQTRAGAELTALPSRLRPGWGGVRGRPLSPREGWASCPSLPDDPASWRPPDEGQPLGQLRDFTRAQTSCYFLCWTETFRLSASWISTAENHTKCGFLKFVINLPINWTSVLDFGDCSGFNRREKKGSCSPKSKS